MEDTRISHPKSTFLQHCLAIDCGKFPMMMARVEISLSYMFISRRMVHISSLVQNIPVGIERREEGEGSLSLGDS